MSNPEAVSNAKSLLLQINYRFVCTLSVWNKLLQCIDRTNKALQQKNISIDLATKLINGLRCTLQGLRDTGFAQNFIEANNLALTMDIEITFSKKSNRQRAKEDNNMSPEDLFKMQMYNVYDVLLAETDWRYEQIKIINDDFSFLFGSSLEAVSTIDLQKSATDLSLKYEKDLNGYEFSCEIESFKFQVHGLIENLKSATPIDILQTIYDFELAESYQNLVVALRIYLTLPVTTASCERSFSKLKLIKNHLRSTIAQERLTNLSIISIEYDIAKNINFDEFINEFAEKKARKVQLK